MENGRGTAVSVPSFERESTAAPPAIGINLADWKHSLSNAIRDPDELIDRLGLPDDLRPAARRAAELFPVVVPDSYLARMNPGDVDDPLLRQVLPLGHELEEVPGFSADALDEGTALRAPGLLQKYQGRALLILTGQCAVNCRYCFRRHYPYDESPKSLEQWEPALDEIAADKSLTEIILSGGDPLLLSDRRLSQFVDRLESISHLHRLRIHSRLPIVLPDRVTGRLLELLTNSRLTPVMVVHANHPNEVVGDCADALSRLVRSGITMLNQSVLLKGVNDTAETLCELSDRLVNLGVMPYYLHQLDRVQGTAQFEVTEEQGRQLVTEMQSRLPGYAVPRYVREVPGAAGKTPLLG